VVGFAAAAVSIGMLGTTLLTTIAGSSFFSTAEREIAKGLLYFDAQKTLVSTITDPTTELTTATYRISYHYKTPPIDSDGATIPTPANITITDQYLSPQGLTTYDTTVTDYSPTLIKVSESPYYHSPVYISISKLDPISPGQSGSIDLTIKYNQPLPQLLAYHGVSAICNQAILSARLPGLDAELTTPLVCLNANADSVPVPSEILAVSLTELINACYTKPMSDDALLACEQLYLDYYNLPSSILDFPSLIIWQTIKIPVFMVVTPIILVIKTFKLEISFSLANLLVLPLMVPLVPLLIILTVAPLVLIT